MSNMNQKQREFWSPKITEKQKGEYCMNCGKDKFILKELGLDDVLCIDHIDNDNSHNIIENLQWLCKGCNTKKNHPRNIEPFTRSATPEMIAQKRNEGRFRSYVFGRMLTPEEHHKGIEHDALVADGAEFVGCSTQAIKNYLFKMCSPKHGIYEWIEKPDGYMYLVFKLEFL